MKKIASIDIGSNTIRMVVLEQGANGDVNEIDSDRAITRLGESLGSEKRLQRQRMDKTVDALRGFLEKCRRHGEVPVHAVATSAVRESVNREEFLGMVREQLGLEIDVIPWEEEARLTLEGVLWKFPPTDKKILVFDIGGGSTEYILSQGRNLIGSAGTLLGVVRLTERFITRHPVDEKEHRALNNFLQAELEKTRSSLPEGEIDLMIGTAGTVTTLAAIDQNLFPYDPMKVHGSILRRDRVRELLDDLKSKSLEERLQVKALERGREDLIIAGAALVLQTLETFACDALTVSEYGLREGIILRHFAG